jgi:2-polyprenyl-3-methyl-5-hydroxy-6-metoxy-1,4-benzoquinol methylase
MQQGSRTPADLNTHHVQIRDEFTRQADTMGAAAVFTDAEILDRIRAAAGLTPQARVLDVACGPGIVAQRWPRMPVTSWPWI